MVSGSWGVAFLPETRDLAGAGGSEVARNMAPVSQDSFLPQENYTSPL